MASVNLLLEYLSALQRGTWETLRTAALAVTQLDEEEDAPRGVASIVANNLAELGHLEWATERTLEWEVTPAQIVSTPALGTGRGILVGARLDALLARVERAARELQVAMLLESQRYGPDVIEFQAASEDGLAVLAHRAGVDFEQHGATRLARCLPTIASIYAAAPEASVPLGFSILRFESEQLEWLPVECIDGDGSYRIDCYRPEYRVVRGASTRKTSQAVSVYCALSRDKRAVTTYNAASREFFVRARARLPVLYARALVLTSGRLPRYDARSARLCYSAIPVQIANPVQRGLAETGEVNDEGRL